MGRKTRQPWKDEGIEDRNRAQKFKKKGTDRNHCEQCGHMMCYYDLHPGLDNSSGWNLAPRQEQRTSQRTLPALRQEHRTSQSKFGTHRRF